MKVGDRVISKNGELGIIEDISDGWADVRYLTPNNKPSCCVGLFNSQDLTIVGNNVVPMPKSKEWWEEANAFCDLVHGIVESITRSAP